MKAINAVWLKGYLAADPVVEIKPKAKPRTILMIGCPQESKLRYSRKTNYFRVCLRGGMAEASAEYLRKGAIVEVFGTLQQNMECPKVKLDETRPKATLCEVWADRINFGSHKICIYRPTGIPGEYQADCGHVIGLGEDPANNSRPKFCDECGGVIHWKEKEEAEKC